MRFRSDSRLGFILIFDVELSFDANNFNLCNSAPAAQSIMLRRYARSQ